MEKRNIFRARAGQEFGELTRRGNQSKKSAVVTWMMRVSARHLNSADPVRDPHESVLDHRVATAVFGGVEGGVGGFDQVAGAECVVRPGASDGDADGDALG